MKSTINLICFFTLIFVTQISVAQQIKDETYNPCQDEKYLDLKSKNINNLSDREFEYFMLKEKECSEYSKLSLISKNDITKESSPYSAGKLYAKKYYRSHADLGGYFSGFLGGFIGWGIGYAILSSQEIKFPSKLLKRYESGDDIMAFEDGYKIVAKSKRNKAFHQTAAIGTVSSALVIFIYTSLYR